MPIDQQEIKNRLQVIFRSVFDDSSIVITEELVADNVAAWTSMTHVIMIDMVEKDFNMKFSLREIMGLKNVGDLINTLYKKLN